MISIKNKFGIGLLTSALMFSNACTDSFEDINTDPYNISDEKTQADFNNVGGWASPAIQNIYAIEPAWVTQLQQNLIGDIYSGYMMTATPFAGNVNNITYSFVDGWNTFPWNTAYQNVMTPLSTMEEEAKKTDARHFIAWSKIIRVEAMHRVTDIYGPIIYSEFGSGTANYDSQEKVYNAFFNELDEAITELTPYAQEENDGDVTAFTPFDIVYGGSYKSWVKFANSLRLRLAIRVSKVDADLAQKQGEAALANPIGLMETSGDNFVVTSPSGATHPLNVINGGWNDIRMGAPMESILTGYNDKRIGKYFAPAADYESDPIGIAGEYKGIRQGIPLTDKNEYVVFSGLTTFGGIQLMTAAETYFLKAEAALYGWAEAGNAQANYEAGITESFTQWGASGAADYILDDTSVPAEYIDPLHDENSIKTGSPYLSTATIAWATATSDEERLEKIITQKWIAMYPDGQEAWSEFRRTGYPKLFPVMVNNSGGTINSDEMVKRVNFILDERNTNPSGVASGVSALGGPDHGGTALWWDVD